MKPSGKAPLAILVAVLALVGGVAEAGPPPLPTDERPAALEGIGIDERPGAQVPRDVVLADQDGRRVEVGELLDGKTPVLMVLAYYQCPMLCTVVLNGLGDGMKALPAGWEPGGRVRVVTVSFDRRDTAALAKMKRAHQIEAYGRPVGAHGWDFFTGDEREVRRLADAVGFRYRWDASTEQFAHAAAAFVLTPDGRLSRTLYGVAFPPDTLRLALLEAAGGRIGTAWERVILFCYHWDPSAGSYTVAATRVMQLGGLVTLLAVALFLGRLAFATRRARDARASNSATDLTSRRETPAS